MSLHTGHVLAILDHQAREAAEILPLVFLLGDAELINKVAEFAAFQQFVVYTAAESAGPRVQSLDDKSPFDLGVF